MQGDYLEDLASAQAGKLTSKGRKQGYPDMELSLVAARIVVRGRICAKRETMQETNIKFQRTASCIHPAAHELTDGTPLLDRVL